MTVVCVVVCRVSFADGGVCASAAFEQKSDAAIAIIRMILLAEKMLDGTFNDFSLEMCIYGLFWGLISSSLVILVRSKKIVLQKYEKFSVIR